jgi:hypothetical protein
MGSRSSSPDRGSYAPSHSPTNSSPRQVTSNPTYFTAKPDTEKTKDYTPRAAAKFKSPLSSSVSASSKLNSSVKFTPTIQALQRKLQVLKRAVKIKQDGDERKLEELALKWRITGREIAWEVWNLVKDRAEAVGNPGSRDGGWGYDYKDEKPFESGWGWDETTSKRLETWGYDRLHMPSNDAGEAVESLRSSSPAYEDDAREDAEKSSDTLGTMLRQLKIDPVTLGWDDELEDFVDDS